MFPSTSNLLAELKKDTPRNFDMKRLIRNALSGPVRDTPPYRGIPFQDSIAERGIAPICLVFMWYRASIAEIPLLWGGIAPPLRECSPRGKRSERGRGYRTQMAMLRHQKPHSAQQGGIAEIVSRYRAIRGH